MTCTHNSGTIGILEFHVSNSPGCCSRMYERRFGLKFRLNHTEIELVCFFVCVVWGVQHAVPDLRQRLDTQVGYRRMERHCSSFKKIQRKETGMLSQIRSTFYGCTGRGRRSSKTLCNEGLHHRDRFAR